MVVISSLITIILLVAAIYNILGLSPKIIADDIKDLATKNYTISQKTLLAQGKMKISRFKKIVDEIQFALEITHREKMFSAICIASIILFISGIIIAVLIQNYILMPVLAVIFSLVPYLYVKASLGAYNKQVREELETALSVITSSYIRTSSIISAVEENIENIKQPVQIIFREFLGNTKLINSNIRLAIAQLKGSSSNKVFQEWCDTLIACQEDRTKIPTLQIISEKMTDLRLVNAEIETQVAGPRNDYLLAVALTYGTLPLLGLLQKAWLEAILFSLPGRIALTITIIVTIICSIVVFKVTRPIEYK